MAIVTPTSTASSELSGAKFIDLVLRKLGVLGSDEAASSEDYAIAKDVVSAALMSMHINGLLWWSVKTDDVAFVSEVADRPEDCAECVYAAWGGRKLRFAERLEYERIQDKLQTGTPEIVIDDGATLTLWPVPGAGNLRLTYQRHLIALSPSATIDVPIRLQRPLIDYMAFDIEPWFDVPQEKLPRIVSDGQSARLMLLAGSRQTVETDPVSVDYF